MPKIDECNKGTSKQPDTESLTSRMMKLLKQYCEIMPEISIEQADKKLRQQSADYMGFIRQQAVQIKISDPQKNITLLLRMINATEDTYFLDIQRIADGQQTIYPPVFSSTKPHAYSRGKLASARCHEKTLPIAIEQVFYSLSDPKNAFGENASLGIADID